MIILIPAYKPDQSLVRLARALREQDPHAEILVIDDGSGSAYAPIFTELRIDGVTVQTHPANKGKGAALRTGIAWAKANRPGEVIVTADADGQHLPRDIFRVGVRTETAAVAGQRSIILGVRTKPDPNAGEEGTKVPLRSKIGNSATVGFFALATGARVADTQTGLRGFTPQILDWLLQIPGDKYEYEFSMLLRATRADVELVQVPIVKVYEPGNPTSHFRPLQDSALIYAPLLAFLASSFLTGFLVDAIALELHRQPNAHARRRRTPLGILLAGTVHRAGGGHPRSQRGSDGSFDRPGRVPAGRQDPDRTDSDPDQLRGPAPLGFSTHPASGKYARKDSGNRRLFRLARGELRVHSHGGCRYPYRCARLPGTPLARLP